jgi:hypothetical protein
MPVTKQKYNLNARHQLIDLNQEFKNFKLDFQVTSADGTQFHAVVIEQEQLDSKLDLKNLDMKIAKGKIGGSIVADKDVYNNYFLVLKSVDDKPVDVELEINIEEIPPAPTPAPETPIVENFQPSETPQPKPVPFYRTSWFALLVIGIILGGLLYYYLFHIKNPIVVTADVTNPPVVATPVPVPETVKKSPDLYSKLRAIS